MNTNSTNSNNVNRSNFQKNEENFSPAAPSKKGKTFAHSFKRFKETLKGLLPGSKKSEGTKNTKIVAKLISEESTPVQVKGNFKKDFETSNKEDFETAYNAISGRLPQQMGSSEATNTQTIPMTSPEPSKLQMPRLKTTIKPEGKKVPVEVGKGASKVILALKKDGLLTKDMLRGIKLRHAIIPVPIMSDLAKALSKSTPRKNLVAFQTLVIELKSYETMTLKEQAKLSKKLKRYLDDTTAFSGKDIALILQRNHQELIKSLKGKEDKLLKVQTVEQEQELRNEITNLRNVINLWNNSQSQNTQSSRKTQIENTYQKLPYEKQILISQFLTKYLKGKRCRAVFDAARREDQREKFKEEEIQPTIDLRRAFSQLDTKIESCRNPQEKKELLKIREWMDDISFPEVGSLADEDIEDLNLDKEEGLVAKKFKFGSLKSILDKKSIAEAQKKEPQLDISPQELLDGIIEVTQGLAAIHSRDCIHRDISLRNILVTDRAEFVPLENGSVEKRYVLHFAIADLGRMQQLKGKDGFLSKESEGPVKWMAPEEMIKNTSSKKSDVYSVGMTMIEALVGPEFETHFRVAPNTGKEPNYAIERFLKYCLDKKLNIDLNLMNLIFSCVSENPKDRPSMEKLLANLQELKTSGTKFALYKKQPNVI